MNFEYLTYDQMRDVLENQAKRIVNLQTDLVQANVEKEIAETQAKRWTRKIERLEYYFMRPVTLMNVMLKKIEEKGRAVEADRFRALVEDETKLLEELKREALEG